jgi:hypothetical protein
MEPLTLSDKEPFGIGGRRLCFVHPLDASKCVKVLRNDAERTIRIANSSAYFARFRREYDNNADEKRALEKLYRRIGPEMTKHLPRCYGVAPTDRGPGLVLDLMRDFDGKISRSIRELISTGTPIAELRAPYDEFSQFLLKHRIQTRNLLDHNIVARREAEQQWTLFLIDGLGDSAWLPIAGMIKGMAENRIRKRIAKAWPKMEQFAASGGVQPSMRRNCTWGQGFLAHRG